MKQWPKLITIDGPKGSGKSETSQAVVTMLNKEGIPALYHKHYRDPKDEYQSMINLILYATSPKNSEVIVADRFLWTEYIMGIYTGRSNPKELYHRCHAIEVLMINNGIPQYLLLPSVSIIAKRLAAREGDRKNTDMPLEVIHPLWKSALAISRMMEYNNVDDVDRTVILQSIRKLYKL